MENIDQAYIISVGVGSWYAKGVSRLENSLVHHGYAGKTLFYKDELPPDAPNHVYDPYAFKIYAIEEAIRRGANILMWLDASFWCIRNPHAIFDIIADKGVFGFKTGYNCAQTCSDSALIWAGITRDEAESLPEIASGMCGLRMDNPDGKKVFDLWREGMAMGLFRNSRYKDGNDSRDPRFLHARQDQSIWSLAIHKAGVKFDYQDYVSYYDYSNPLKNSDKAYFYIGGL